MGRRRSGRGGGGGDGLIVVALVALVLVVVLAIAVPLVLPVAWLIYEMRRTPTPGGTDPFGLTLDEREELVVAERRRRDSQRDHQQLRREARGHKKRSDGKLDARNRRARELNEELPAAAALQAMYTDEIDELVHRPIVRWNQWAAPHRNKWGMRVALVFGVGVFVAVSWMRWTRYLDFFDAEGGMLTRAPHALWAYARALMAEPPELIELLALFAPAGATIIGFAIGREVGLARAATIIPIPPVATIAGDPVHEEDAGVEDASSAGDSNGPVEDAPAMGLTLDASGKWSTEYVYQGVPHKIAMRLEQVGTRVTGTSGKSKLAGELSGRLLVGRWEEGGARGGLRFEFSEDGQRFLGTWDTEGESESGTWNGERKP